MSEQEKAFLERMKNYFREEIPGGVGYRWPVHHNGIIIGYASQYHKNPEEYVSSYIWKGQYLPVSTHSSKEKAEEAAKKAYLDHSRIFGGRR